MQTVQQERARHALEQIRKLEAYPDKDKLKARASELPFMIHANGLGATAAFFRSKGDKDGYQQLYQVLQSWLSTSKRPFEKQDDLMDAITQSDMTTYRLAQAEAMVYLDWVKKFALAYLSGSKASNKETA
ncbi:type III-B CRISPR module-associated protein Cmr5 [Pokkaliibacter plantistimulans]|nr:type III-B CRISPR module-associated protein Cmr5 [Pokkaliibacter plantistimulans]